MTGQVYRFYNDSGDLLYVGSALYAMSRVGKHQSEKPWFGEVSTIKLEHFSTRQAAFDAEIKAIQAEKPKYNVTQFVDWENLASPPRIGQKCPDGCRCGRHTPTKLSLNVS